LLGFKGSSQHCLVRASVGDRLAELGATPSIGSIGDSYDNALAETVNGLHKTELVYGPDQRP
jgi:transposase InsO family protein